MVASIFVWFLIILLLLPDAEVVITNRYFGWYYSRSELFKNIGLFDDEKDL